MQDIAGTNLHFADSARILIPDRSRHKSLIKEFSAVNTPSGSVLAKGKVARHESA
jgi:hypothetical protein